MYCTCSQRIFITVGWIKGLLQLHPVITNPYIKNALIAKIEDIKQNIFVIGFLKRSIVVKCADIFWSMTQDNSTLRKEKVSGGGIHIDIIGAWRIANFSCIIFPYILVLP